MKNITNRNLLVKVFVVFALTLNIWLAFALTIKDIRLDPSILTEFSYWFEFITTLALGYSTMGALLILGIEVTKYSKKLKKDKDGNEPTQEEKDKVTEYEFMYNSIIDVNKNIKSESLSNDLSNEIKHDNIVNKLQAYLVKCDRRGVKRWYRLWWNNIEFWRKEYQLTLEYLTAYESNNKKSLNALIKKGYILKSKRVRYKQIKESALLNGRSSSNDENDMNISIGLYVIDKKLPFLLLTFLITIIGTVIIEDATHWENWNEFVAKLFVIIWNAFMGFLLGKDIVDNYLITQMNKIRLYLQKFYDKNKPKEKTT